MTPYGINFIDGAAYPMTYTTDSSVPPINFSRALGQGEWIIGMYRDTRSAYRDRGGSFDLPGRETTMYRTVYPNGDLRIDIESDGLVRTQHYTRNYLRYALRQDILERVPIRERPAAKDRAPVDPPRRATRAFHWEDDL